MLLFVTGRKAQLGIWRVAAGSADCTADDKDPIRVASIRVSAVELLEQGDE